MPSVTKVLIGVILCGVAIAIIAVGLDQTVPESTFSQRDATATHDDADAPTTSASEPTLPPSSDLDGQGLFASQCSSCHGTDLEGDVGPALDRGSEASELSDRRMTLAILEGSADKMPAFEGRLTSEQIDQIIEYVRDIQQG